MVSLSVHAVRLLSVLPPALRACQLQVHSPFVPPSCWGAIRIAPQQLGGTNGECTWSWQARKAGGKTESKRTACTDKLTIARVPYALDRTQSGVSVTVKLPDGRELAEPEVVVEDLFVVALGDSFASGESNPDRPVQFSAGREMVYEPSLL